MSASPIQYVTLVSGGGTPVRLADQQGRPYPTTGHGALVFNVNPTIDSPIFTGSVNVGEGGVVGFSNGSAQAPSIFFGDVGRQDGIFSAGPGHVNITVGGFHVASFSSAGLTIAGDISYSGRLNGAYHTPLTTRGDIYIFTDTPTRFPLGPPGTILSSNGTNLGWVTVGAGTMTSVSAGSGLTATPNPITSVGTISLSNTTVAPGNYGDSTRSVAFTVDSQGRLTAASSLEKFLPLSGGTITGSVAIGGTLSVGNTLAVGGPIETTASTITVRSGSSPKFIAHNIGGGNVAYGFQSASDQMQIGIINPATTVMTDIFVNFETGGNAHFSDDVYAHSFISAVDQFGYALIAGRHSPAFGRAVINTAGAYGYTLQINGAGTVNIDAGSAEFAGGIYAGFPGTGRAGIFNVGPTNSGYIGFFLSDGSRTGYIGFGADRLYYISERAGNLHEFQGTIFATGYVAIGPTGGERLKVTGLTDNESEHIAAFYANNQTQGIGISYSSIRKIGTVANTDLYIDGNGLGRVGIGYNCTGTTALGRSPADTSNSTEAATTAWVRANVSSYVSTNIGPGSSFGAVMTAVEQTIGPGGGWAVAGYGEHYDPTGALNATNGVWSPNVRGVYRITGFATMRVDTTPGPMRIGLFRQSSGHWLAVAYCTTSVSQTATWSVIIQCNVGDTFVMIAENLSSAGGYIYGSSLYTGFSANMIGTF